MKITIKELRQLIRETIREQTGVLGALGQGTGINVIRQLFNGFKTGNIYLQINNLPDARNASGVIPIIRNALMQQQESIIGEFAAKLADDAGQILPNVAGLRTALTGYVAQQVTGAQIQWGGSGDLPYGVVVVSILGGENLSPTWKDNFRRRAENLLKQNISRNITVRLTQTATPTPTATPTGGSSIGSRAEEVASAFFRR